MKKIGLFVFSVGLLSQYLQASDTKDLIAAIKSGNAQAFETSINDKLYRKTSEDFNDMIISLKGSGIDLNTSLSGTHKDVDYSIKAIDLLLLTVGRDIAYDHALFRTHHRLLSTLLEYGADINAPYPGYGYNLLLEACDTSEEYAFFNEDLQKEPCFLEYVQFLLNNGADINAVNNIQENGLMLAVEGAHVKLVKLLLDNGINVHAQEKDNWTALMMAEVDAEEFNNFEIVNLLLRYGAQ